MTCCPGQEADRFKPASLSWSSHAASVQLDILTKEMFQNICSYKFPWSECRPLRGLPKQSLKKNHLTLEIHLMEFCELKSHECGRPYEGYDRKLDMHQHPKSSESSLVYRCPRPSRWLSQNAQH